MSAKAPILFKTRICDADRTALAADNTDYTVNKGSKPNLIFVAQVDEEAGTYTTTYTLMWKNTTDTGAFANLAATGQINWAATTNLVQGTNVTTKLCTAAGAAGSTWQNGEEVEGAATSDSIALVDEYYTEIHFAINIASALEGKTYDFQIWENTGGTALAVAAAASLIVTSDQPTVVLNTADLTDFGADTTPTLEFTGTDASGSDVRYNIQIDTVNTFDSTSVGFDLKYVDLLLAKLNFPQDNLTLEIRTSIDSGVLGTSNAVAGTTLSTTAGYIRFTFATPVTIDTDKHYMVLARSGVRDQANYYTWSTLATGTYANGEAYRKGSSVWVEQPHDFMFIAYDAVLTAKVEYDETPDSSLGLYGDIGAFGEEAGQSFTPSIIGAILDKTSNIAPTEAFVNTTDGGDTDPFDSGDKCSFTVQAGEELTTDTYYWRVRGIDPSPGSGLYGAWAATRQFDVDTGGAPSAFIPRIIMF